MSAWAHLCVLECVCVHKLAYKWAKSCQCRGVVKNNQIANPGTRSSILFCAMLMSLAYIRSHCHILLMRTTWKRFWMNYNVMMIVEMLFWYWSKNVKLELTDYAYVNIFSHIDFFFDPSICLSFYLSIYLSIYSFGKEWQLEKYMFFVRNSVCPHILLLFTKHTFSGKTRGLWSCYLDACSSYCGSMEIRSQAVWSKSRRNFILH